MDKPVANLRFWCLDTPDPANFGHFSLNCFQLPIEAVEPSEVSGGPTQNYDDPTLGQWRPRPMLAALVRGTIALGPGLLGLGWGVLASQVIPPERLGWPCWLWFVVVSAVAIVLVSVVTSTAQRFVPMVTLLRLSLIFPDRVPSRFEIARRTHSPAALRERIDAVRARPGAPLNGEDLQAHRLLQLVAALSVHDSRTRGHSERVQAYAAMIGEQLGLKPPDAARLSWAALLHDIGKLHVASETLNSPGKPTEKQWAEIQRHPEGGRRIAEPLADWLGPWFSGIGQHHERWDGHGYPAGLRGEEISLSARIIAVADTYDVITSARSYKKPLSAAAAREELARVAGSQLDPGVVRVFLGIGIGRLRGVAFSISALSGLPGLNLPIPTALAPGGLTGPLASAVGGLAGVAVALGTAVAPPATAQDEPPAEGVTYEQPSGGAEDAGVVDFLDPRAMPRADDPDEASTDPTAAAEPTSVGDDAEGNSAAPVEIVPTPPAAGSAPAGSAGSVSGGEDCATVRAGGDGHDLDLTDCDLSGLVLDGDYGNSDLTGAILSGTTLSDAQLHHADLNGADLSGATLIGTDLHLANLAHVDASGAVFRDSDLHGADVTGAVLDRATFDGVDLNHASGTPARASKTVWVDTRCPDGSYTACF